MNKENEKVSSTYRIITIKTKKKTKESIDREILGKQINMISIIC